MRSHLLRSNNKKNHTGFKHQAKGLKKSLSFLCMLVLALAWNSKISAQGSWAPVVTLAPNANLGGMLLLSDGTVLCKSDAGGGDGIGNIYNRLTPDANGSYANGTWSSIAAMNKTRLYYSSQVLKDGRVYVAGGEYGSGGSSGETYDPLTNVWTMAGAIGSFVSDANSEILEDGRVIQALVTGNLKPNKIYDPVSNTYIIGPDCVGIHNESAWLKLKDNSILFVDRGSRNSERYIPSTNTWIADATVPVDLYDPFGLETGGALLLPDGRAFFIGSLGHCAIYTPSGNKSPGSWAAAADIPNKQGTPDAAAAMMVNGKILLATSATPTSFNHFPSPTSYYVYDYLTNAFTRIASPDGDSTDPVPCYYTGMLCLPNGQIMFALQGQNQYYVYTPDGSPLAAGKPVISNIQKVSKSVYRITGKMFNGISEGATYGDDWQMNTNFPILSAVDATGKVYYIRTYNWNSTGVMRGTKRDTAYFKPPVLPPGTYSVYVSANGISSDPLVVSVAPQGIAAVNSSAQDNMRSENLVSLNKLQVYPNPVRDQATISFSLAKTTHVSLSLVDVSGKRVQTLYDGSLEQGAHSMQFNFAKFAQGVYMVRMTTDKGTENIKFVRQ